MLLHTISAETLLQIADAMPLRVFWKDHESRFLGCNRLFAEDAGITDLQDFIGKTDFYFYHSEQARAFRADDAHVMVTGEAKLGIIEELTLEDGSTQWVETNKLPLRNGAGEIVGILGAYQDVTARILAQKAAA